MTYLEYVNAHIKEREIHTNIDVVKNYCPDDFTIEDNQECMVWANPTCTSEEQKEICRLCWNREMPGTLNAGKTDAKPRILDSGNRRKFESGAVRDICEGKGRCDLMPMAVIACLANEPVLKCIENFQIYHGIVDYLYPALAQTYKEPLMMFPDKYTMLLEVSKHFEAGAFKYGDNNWRKGIPVHCYIDSAVRHYLKYCRGDTDEPHDRAFCWNLMCAIWTCKNKPELNDYDERNVRNDEQTEANEN